MMIQKKKYNIIFVFTACKKSGPIQQILNLVTYINRDKFNPIIVTIYPEPKDGTSQLSKFLGQNIKHYYCPISKLDIILGYTSNLKRLIRSLTPDIIHTMGVFPDYAISHMRLSGHIITLHNFIYDDYPMKFGKLKGILLANIHLFAIKRTPTIFTCSESLSKKYEQRFGYKFEFIRNGVDISKYCPVDEKTKAELRLRLDLPLDKKIFIYTGQFIARKDQKFLITIFTNSKLLRNNFLVLLGDGNDFKALTLTYKTSDNILMPGNVNNVTEYLQACDVYISSSRSEGLPYGVLEAMASGLPVILSDIEQHKEIYNVNPSIGYIYRLGNADDCIDKIKKMLSSDMQECGRQAYYSAHKLFSAEIMSKNYQNAYWDIIKKHEEKCRKNEERN